MREREPQTCFFITIFYVKKVFKKYLKINTLWPPFWHQFRFFITQTIKYKHIENDPKKVTEKSVILEETFFVFFSLEEEKSVNLKKADIKRVHIVYLKIFSPFYGIYLRQSYVSFFVSGRKKKFGKRFEVRMKWILVTANYWIERKKVAK